MTAVDLITRGARAISPAFAAIDREVTTRHHAYQEPQSTMTLAEGLEEYYASGGLYDSGMGAHARRWFKAHDVAHVLFGCSVTPEQESIVDAWTMFGTTWQWAEYLGEVRYPEQRERILREIFGEIGLRRTMVLVISTAPHVLEVRRRARRMYQQWDYYGHEHYHSYRLADIRQEYNIEPLCM